MGDAEAAQTYVKRVKALTRADLRQVASNYLKLSNLTVVVLVPDGADERLTGSGLKKIAEEAVAKADSEAKSAPSESRVEKIVLDNGLTLLVKENHSVPTVAVRAALLGGLRYETPETNGVSRLAASLLSQGSSNHTAGEMATAVESMAGRMDGFSGRNSLGLAAEFLSEDWERGLGLVAEVLLTPTFEPGEIEKKKSDLLAAIAQRQDDLFSDALLLFSRNLYDGHPYAMDTLGTEESVRFLTRRDVLQFYRRALRPKNLVVAVVGDIRAEEVRAGVGKLFGSLTERPSEPLNLAPLKPLEEVVEATTERNKQQAHIFLGFPGVRLDSPDRYPLDVIEGVLAGQSGRLFVELRDKQSLAYALTAFAQANLDPGFVAVYVGTSPDKVDEVVEGIRRELKRLVEEPVGPEELEAARRAIIGSYELRHQTNASQAESLSLMELYGLGYQAVREYPLKIQEVTKEDLQRVARRYLTLDRYVLALVRPQEPAQRTSTPDAQTNSSAQGPAPNKADP
jgi:zinc protease